MRIRYIFLKYLKKQNKIIYNMDNNISYFKKLYNKKKIKAMKNYSSRNIIRSRSDDYDRSSDIKWE